MSNGTLKVDDGRSWSFLTSNILRLQHRFGEHSLGGLLGQEWYERHSRTSHVEMYDQLIAGERNVGGFAKQGRTMPEWCRRGQRVMRVVFRYFRK